MYSEYRFCDLQNLQAIHFFSEYSFYFSAQWKADSYMRTWLPCSSLTGCHPSGSSCQWDWRGGRHLPAPYCHPPPSSLHHPHSSSDGPCHQTVLQPLLAAGHYPQSHLLTSLIFLAPGTLPFSSFIPVTIFGYFSVQINDPINTLCFGPLTSSFAGVLSFSLPLS